MPARRSRIPFLLTCAAAIICGAGLASLAIADTARDVQVALIIIAGILIAGSFLPWDSL